jgi:hypothetical protein
VAAARAFFRALAANDTRAAAARLTAPAREEARLGDLRADPYLGLVADVAPAGPGAVAVRSLTTMRAGTGCLAHAPVRLPVRRGAAGWAIDDLGALATAARPCACPQVPWRSEPGAPPPEAAGSAPLPATPLPRGHLQPVDVTSAETIWGTTRAPTAVATDGRITWPAGLPGSGQGASLALRFAPGTRLGCVQIDADGAYQRVTRLALTAGRLGADGVQVIDPSTHAELRISLAPGPHWLRHPFVPTDVLTLHIDGVLDPQAPTPPPLRVTLWGLPPE